MSIQNKLTTREEPFGRTGRTPSLIETWSLYYQLRLIILTYVDPSFNNQKTKKLNNSTTTCSTIPNPFNHEREVALEREVAFDNTSILVYLFYILPTFSYSSSSLTINKRYT